MSFSEGEVLDGKYVIRRRIAEGGMSTVYLGVNRRIGKDVAVKVLHPGVAQDAELVNRFEREACIVSRIRSANVADVYDFGELPTGECFMVMEYLDGESLATKLDREGTIAPTMIAPIAEQILVALTAAHEAGVVHRDLKPENVLLTERSGEITAKVVDFGISKVLPRSPWRDTQHTDTNRAAEGLATKVDVRLTSFDSVLGTPLYMSPEQALGNSGAIDERTDIYALGVILYEATSGDMPLIADNVNDLLLRVVFDEPEPLERRMPAVDPAWSAIVSKALAKNPSDRYQSADEMRGAIRDWTLAYRTATSRVTSPVLQFPAPKVGSSCPNDDLGASPSPMPISIDGITSPDPSTARPSIVVELVDDSVVGAPQSSLLKRWPRVALVGLVFLGALMAQRALVVTHREPAPVRGPARRAAPASAACPLASPPPGEIIVTALGKP